MGERLKVLVVVAALGFLGGVIADITARYIIPVLIQILPGFVNAEWVLAGLAGSALTLFFVAVWAYITGPSGPE